MVDMKQVQNGIASVLPTAMLLVGVALLIAAAVWAVLQLRAAEKGKQGRAAAEEVEGLPAKEDLAEERCRRLEEVIRAQKQQISTMELQLADAAKMRHDFKQELLLLQEFARNGDREELERYLPQAKLENKTAIDIPLCPNPLVNTLLQFYFKKARASGIDIDAAVQADNDLWLSAGDVGVLLGNLLENAVTAAAEAPASQRRLRLRTTQRKDCFVIAMGNTFGTPRAQKENGEFVSTKADHTGIGLNSIRAVARSYDGDAKFVLDGEMFMCYVIDCEVLLWAEDDHLARQGLRSHACDFLVLPLDDERFLHAMKKCTHWADGLRSIRCAVGGATRKFRCIEVQYVESFGHSCTLHSREEAFTINSGLTRVQEQLGPGFIRCHKSYVVNIRYVAQKRDRELLLRDGTVLPLGSTCTETMTAALDDCAQRLACFIGGGAE